ncbi:tRNA pseudouridine(13) synthase TruD [Alteromonas facilis]|uniref:tRNA pseudouridine(13) synthase TruD n=1 Tax=Alteromonas facilis TaxID=2048004 RepID=UPI000C287D07|nr:tRNA pseudouridine(13) synthase TruD [Alteromonas facilis]
MTLALSTDWQYLHGKPKAHARFKSLSQDFIVKEQLGYELTGSGEHVFLWIQKEALNTAFVAEQIAKFCGVPLRAVSYAGRKDKFAITQQWIGVHLPGNKDPDWNKFVLEGAQILSSTRHNKKLRTGQLKGNTFEICLRDVTDMEEVLTRANLIKQKGVPNYFAEQRFGVVRGADGKLHLGGNLDMAQRMINGETIRNRNKRSMAISALRSWFFNHVTSERIKSSCYHTILNGDAMQLCGSNSFFITEVVDEVLSQRLASGDIAITAPMAGKGQWLTKSESLAFEQSCAQHVESVINTLAKLDLKQERRAISLTPEEFEWNVSGDDLNITLTLPSGSYATAVIRELVNTEENS